MISTEKLWRLHTTKGINRLLVRTIRDSDQVEVQQTHRNGDDEIVGEICLDGLEDVYDLHYALSQIIKACETETRE